MRVTFLASLLIAAAAQAETPVAVTIAGSLAVLAAGESRPPRLEGDGPASAPATAQEGVSDAALLHIVSAAAFGGAPGYAMITDSATDADGNAYVTGTTFDPDFPRVNPALPLQPLPEGFYTTYLFVAKISRSTSRLVYSTLLKVGLESGPPSITVDANGRAVVAGSTTNTAFPTTPGAFQPEPGDCILPYSDTFESPCPYAFVLALDPTGSKLLYSTFLDGESAEAAYDVAVDGTGSAYVAGSTMSVDFPARGGLPRPPNLTRFVGRPFVAKLTPDGSDLEYSALITSSTSSGSARGIAVDRVGRAYVVGRTSLSGFPVVKALFPALGGMTDCFVTVLSPAGDQIEFSTYLGGSGLETPYAVAIEPQGSVVWVAGATDSTDFPTANALQTANSGGDDAFVCRIDIDSPELLSATYLGGTADDYADSIVLDPSGDAWLVGGTSSSDFPAVGAIQPTLGGGADAFITHVDASGQLLLFCSFIGGSEADVAGGVQTARPPGGEDEDVWVAGTTGSTDFPITATIPDGHQGPGPLFLARLSSRSVSLDVGAGATPARGGEPLTAALSAAAVAGTPPYDYSWEFDDGSPATGEQDTTHVFVTPGEYWPTVTVTDAVGAIASARVPVIVDACTLGCTSSFPTAAAVGQQLLLTSSAQPAGACDPEITFSWSIDGAVVATSRVFQYAFAAAGLHQWTLSVTAGQITCVRGGVVLVTDQPVAMHRMVPGVAHKAGFSGTSWRTDLTLVNAGASPVAATLVFYPASGTPAVQSVTVEAGAAREWRDVVASLFGLPEAVASSGTVHVVADGPLAVTARTYNQTPGGTYGQEMPALASTDGGDSAVVLPGLKKNGWFRTNAGAVNLGTRDATVTFTLVDPDGNQLGTPRTIQVPPGRWRQEDDLFALAGVASADLAYARVEIAGDTAVWIYASLVDAATGDPTTITAVSP